MKLIEVKNTKTGETLYFKAKLGAAKFVGKTVTRLNLVLAGIGSPISGYEIKENGKKYMRNTKFIWIEYNIIEEKDGWIYYKANTSDFISVSRKLTNINKNIKKGE